MCICFWVVLLQFGVAWAGRGDLLKHEWAYACGSLAVLVVVGTDGRDWRN